MKLDYDEAYYRRRESAARDLAEKSGDSQVRRIHEEMAKKYAVLAEEAAAAS